MTDESLPLSYPQKRQKVKQKEWKSQLQMSFCSVIVDPAFCLFFFCPKHAAAISNQPLDQDLNDVPKHAEGMIAIIIACGEDYSLTDSVISRLQCYCIPNPFIAWCLMQINAVRVFWCSCALNIKILAEPLESNWLFILNHLNITVDVFSRNLRVHFWCTI